MRMKVYHNTWTVLAWLAIVSLASCDFPAESAAVRPRGRLLVLGFDGMDAALTRKLMDAGRLPNMASLAAKGTFEPLATSMPPQSPVAWSNMISGAQPDTHQIYDFIHRDASPPEPYLMVRPYLSTSKVVPPGKERAISIPWSRWRIPLSGQTIRLLRQGPAFWDLLIAHGIDTTIYRIPANYPPPKVKGAGKFICLCGMGTPDLMGTYGLFTFFTPHAPLGGEEPSGGKLVYWYVQDHRATGSLTGPANFLLKPVSSKRTPPMTVEFEVVRDPEAPVAKIEVQDHLLLLNQGEWSDWVPIDFETGIPGSAILSAMQSPTSMRAMVRFYLKQVHPDLLVYVTPLNIDPMKPVNPISTPASFADDLAEATGRYYTTGIPQDTKILRADAFNEDEYLSQCRIILDERIKQYHHALDHLDEDCLFFYFGSVDQLSHIFWRDQDPQHPGRKPEQGDRYAKVIEDCYIEMDHLVGAALKVMGPDDTLIVMSDHGFTSFRRGMNLNTWLLQNGYIVLLDPSKQEKAQILSNVDWTQTRAYALGINSLYVNLRGREKGGIVEPGDGYESLLAEISEKLLSVRDEDETLAVDRVYQVNKIYPKGDINIAPDLLVGYAKNYRGSWATALGGMPKALFEDNLDRWSGDHCNAHHLVPGILVTNRKLKVQDPALSDIGPTILDVFGITPPSQMTGRPLFAFDDQIGR